MRRFFLVLVLCLPFVLWFLAGLPFLMAGYSAAASEQSEPVSYRVIKASKEGTIEKEINALVAAGCYPILAAGGSAYDNEVTVILECKGRRVLE